MHALDPRSALAAVKLVHTAVWAVFAGCILWIPVAALSGRLWLATGLSVLVLVEVLTLALNGWRCPLTDVAARFTDRRAANFDIYLPEWLARNNKRLFGALFVLGLAILAWSWFRGGLPPLTASGPP
jgi:hypothetical protein